MAFRELLSLNLAKSFLFNNEQCAMNNVQLKSHSQVYLSTCLLVHLSPCLLFITSCRFGIISTFPFEAVIFVGEE